MSVVVRVNGRSVGAGSEAISPLDHGFLYGNGLFETMRALCGQPFALQDHLRRIREAGLVIGLPVPPEEALAEEVLAAVAQAAADDAYVRLTVTRGPGAPGPDPSTCGAPTVVVVVKPFPEAPRHWAEQGLSAVISSIRRSSTSPLTRVKSTSYLECILAKQQARQRGAEEAVLLDTEGNLAEATAWNLFLVDGGWLRTPDEAGPLLPGITRAIILRLAAELSIPSEMAIYEPGRLARAAEAFLTNSLYGVVPLGRLDGAPIGGGTLGPLTRLLAREYDALLRADREAR